MSFPTVIEISDGPASQWKICGYDAISFVCNLPEGHRPADQHARLAITHFVYEQDVERRRSAMDVARHVGSDSQRQSVGLPGHCALCVREGHEIAHPELGCSDVGCDVNH